MYPAAHYPRWWEEWGRKDVEPGAFGENITVLGLEEGTACLGDRYAIGEAILEVTSPRTPCLNLARRHGVRDLVARVRATHRHGWYLRVMREGWIESGQAVALVDRPYPQWPVSRAARVAWDATQRRDEAALLARCPALIPDWRESLEAKLNARGRAER